VATTPPPTLIQLTGLTKRFPVSQRWVDLLRRPFRSEYVDAVSDVTFSVAAGEFFGLLGPNGAGKTTLFKMLATLVLPDSGTATVAGHDVATEPAAVRRLLVPVIADERSLHWRVSARENLRLFAVLQGVPRDEVRARIDDLLRVVGLDDAGDKQVGKFSSGMKQRLLIARALIARPRVLLLDEPTRSLDPLSAREFRTFLRQEISGAQGCTILLATHNAEEALDMCDRVAILNRGRLLALGPPDQLAAELEGNRHRVWTTAPRHPSFAALQARGTVRCAEPEETTTAGWTPVVLDIDGGPHAAAQALAFLVESGVPISRFERARMSLAELMAHVVGRPNEEESDA
jgi:ABC-2 type transport system ATP-binding protein